MPYILLLILLLIPINALAVDGHVSFGAYTDSTLRADPDGTDTAEYIAEMEIGQQVEMFRPWVSVKTLMDGRDSSNFYPSSVGYEVGTSVDIWKGLYFEVSHKCWHPVDSKQTVEQYNLFKIGWQF